MTFAASAVRSPRELRKGSVQERRRWRRQQLSPSERAPIGWHGMADGLGREVRRRADSTPSFSFSPSPLRSAFQCSILERSFFYFRLFSVDSAPFYYSPCSSYCCCFPSCALPHPTDWPIADRCNPPPPSFFIYFNLLMSLSFVCFLLFKFYVFIERMKEKKNTFFSRVSLQRNRKMSRSLVE